MSTHNICFYGDWRKLSFNYYQIPSLSVPLIIKALNTIQESEIFQQVCESFSESVKHIECPAFSQKNSSLIKQTTSEDEEIDLAELNLEENCQKLVQKVATNRKPVNALYSPVDVINVLSTIQESENSGQVCKSISESDSSQQFHSNTKPGYTETNRNKTSKEIPAGIKRHENNRFLVYSGERRNNQKQSIYLIGAILFLINLTFVIPIGIHFVAVYETSVQLSKVLFQLLILIPMTDSFFNPWIYALQSQEFRQALMDNASWLYSLVRRK